MRQSNLNMKIASLLTLLGFNIGLYYHSQAIIMSFVFNLHSCISEIEYTVFMVLGFVSGYFLSAFYPEAKNKIDSLSGFNSVLFNYIDYIASILAGYSISYAFFIFNASVTYFARGNSLLNSNENKSFFISLIIVFGLLHGFFYRNIIDGKIFVFENAFSRNNKILIFLVFTSFYIFVSPIFTNYIYEFSFYGANYIYGFLKTINFSEKLIYHWL